MLGEWKMGEGPGNQVILIQKIGLYGFSAPIPEHQTLAQNDL